MSVQNFLDVSTANQTWKDLQIYSMDTVSDVGIGGNLAVVGTVSAGGGVIIPGLNANSLVKTDGSGNLTSVVGQSSGKLAVGSPGDVLAGSLLGDPSNGLSVSYVNPDLQLALSQNLSAAGSPSFQAVSLTNLSNQVVLGGVNSITLSGAAGASPYTAQFQYPGFGGVTNVLYSDFVGTQTINSGNLDVSAGNLSASTGDVLAKRFLATQNGSQLVLGVPGNQTVINSVPPAAPQTISIPDSLQPAADFVLSELAQTINAVKTFTSRPVVPEYWTSRTSSGAQSIPNNTATLIQFGTAIGSSNFPAPTNTNTRFTPSNAGRYLVTYMLDFNPSAVGARLVEIVVNSATEYGIQRYSAAAAGETILNGSAIIIFNGTTDFFEVRTAQDSGGALNVGSGRASQIQASYLGV